MVGLEPVHYPFAQGGDRLGDEFDGQAVVVCTLSVAVGIEFVERAGRDSGGDEAQHHPGEHIRQVELARVGVCGSLTN